MAETPSALQLAQLARLLGLEELRASSAPHEGSETKAIDTERLRSVVDERLERLARSLLEETVACDDVMDVASAEAYLEDRLAFFGGLLSEEQRRRLRELYLESVRRWGLDSS
jgi:hypothetical protein